MVFNLLSPISYPCVCPLYVPVKLLVQEGEVRTSVIAFGPGKGSEIRDFLQFSGKKNELSAFSRYSSN